MASDEDRLCVNCDNQPGALYRLDLTTRDGDRESYRMAFCDDCASAFNEADWISVSAVLRRDE